jgi:cyclic 2,3-diphosphoglycerate synthetase
MRVLALVDGEHYPPVVRAALEAVPRRFAGARVVAAAMLGGTEKLPDHGLDLGVPVVGGGGDNPDDALCTAIADHAPDLVVDLSDDPVLDDRVRLRLVARTVAAGIPYAGADFRVDPPPRPQLTGKPSIAVIGTGKRTGKTAVTAHVARLLKAAGNPPVIVAMGRGGPLEPELIDPAEFDLSVDGLLALADAGRHAASDHVEDAVMAGVVTVGTRRCGGGLAGAPFDDTFAAGVRVADHRPERLLLFEGSGRAIPPAAAGATVCVVAADGDPELLSGYFGMYRLLLSDAVVVTMCEPATARQTVSARGGAAVTAPPDVAETLERSIRGLVPGVRIIRTVFRPTPLAPIDGRRVVLATTAPPGAAGVLQAHLEREHGCSVVGVSHHLANRPLLRADLEAMGEADTLVVELKAAAVDLAIRVAAGQGMEIVFCDNRVVSVGGDCTLEELVPALAQRAALRSGATALA